MPSRLLAAVLLWLGSAALSSGQSLERITVESAASVTKFYGERAGARPDMVVDITATVRLDGGWVVYARPWFRQASTAPYAVAKEVYQAAVQHQRRGRVGTRIDLGYILSPIGIGMLDMRPDTNPLAMTHLSYIIPMPTFETGAPAASPIASSYPLGGVFTASTAHWDSRFAILAAPPNRGFVINAAQPNPSARPFVVVGGGFTPRTGLRIGVAYGQGDYARAREFALPTSGNRQVRMTSVEGELAFGYTKLTGEVTRDAIDTASGPVTATQWFIQGMHTLAPRWYVAGRYEGANAPPSKVVGTRPTLRTSEVAAGFRISPEFTLKHSFTIRKTYFSRVSDRQIGAALVWARRWR